MHPDIARRLDAITRKPQSHRLAKIARQWDVVPEWKFVRTHMDDSVMPTNPALVDRYSADAHIDHCIPAHLDMPS